MKAGNGNHYDQSYNAQAAVDTEGSMLILGKYVTAHVNDKLELEPCVKSVDPDFRDISEVSSDTGYYSEKAVLTVEDNGKGPTVYCAVEKHGHHQTVEDLEEGADPPPLPKEGKERYKLRKKTVEPVFGIIKSIMGFRQFMLRGKEKVDLEWDLVTLSYNFKRLYNINKGKKLSTML